MVFSDFTCMWTSFPAMEAVGAAETRHGEWSVTRLRSAARGTANIESLSLGVGPRGGLGEQGDSVSRLLVLTSTSLVERRPENYEVDSLSPILYELFKLFSPRAISNPRNGNSPQPPPASSSPHTQKRSYDRFLLLLTLD
jgi:hypothetical protein